MSSNESDSFLVFLDTRNSLNPSTPNDTSFLVSLDRGEIKYNSITLAEMSFLNGYYPVNSSNNTLVFRENGGVVSYTATVSEGFYTGASIASELQTRMNAAGGALTYSVIYNTSTNKISITTTIPDTYIIMPTSTILSVLGFDANTNLQTETVTKTGANPVRLDGPEYVLVCSNTLSQGNFSSDNRSNVICKIPLTQAFGSYMSYREFTTTPFALGQNEIGQIDFRLVTDTGAPFTLPSNHHVSYTLVLRK